jgi:exopolysaccharide biosynthesis polyprenyl glycosylphosphotransferase
MHRKQQKKWVILHLAKLALVFANTAVFTLIWYLFYSNVIMLPFYNKGNYIVVALFLVLYICFSKLYGGFSLTVSRISEIIYSQCVAIIMTGFIMYFVTLLLVRHLPNVLPLLLCMGVCIVISTLWTYPANRLSNKVFPPQRTVLIYENADARYSGKVVTGNMYSRFYVVDEVCATCGTEKVFKILEICEAEAVFICGVRSSQRNDIVKFCIENNIIAYIRPTIGDLLVDSAQHLQMCNLPVLRCQRLNQSTWHILGKRLSDILLGLILFLILSPLMCLTAIAIKMYDGGPVLYRQSRLTRDRRQFYVYKFRSMRVDAEKDGVARLAARNDDRITPVGRIIRKVRIDELPQILNILKGEMTFVGPRPERPEIAKQYEQDMPEFALRLQVKAGLTGFAQVYGKYNTSPYDKLQMDLMYIARQGFVTDLKIILATIKILFLPGSTEGIAQGQTMAVLSDENKLTEEAVR